jgi:hypothetical protein
MDFNVSGVGDVNREIKILAPWFLNCLNQYSGSSPEKLMLKHEIFGRIPMDAFKADPKIYKKYVDLKGSQEYTEMIDPLVTFLEGKGYIRIGVNRAKIAITPQGVTKCNESPDLEWSFNQRYYLIKDDDESAKDPGYLKYR